MYNTFSAIHAACKLYTELIYLPYHVLNAVLVPIEPDAFLQDVDAEEIASYMLNDEEKQKRCVMCVV